MNIIIIEDEVKTAKLLEGMIAAVRPGDMIVAKLQSIEGSVAYLSVNPAPDLIFMDIQLSDGLCFEIFGAVKVECPVVFCTAFDHYSLEAFKTNGIAYIVKPFTKEDLALVFKKVDELSRFFAPDVSELLARMVPPAGGKKSFLVFKEQKYLTVATDRIAYFYIRHGATTIHTFDQQDYAIPQSLDQVAGQVSATQFFRLNRQYLINFGAIKEVEHYFLRKLIVHLVVPAPDTLLINKERSQSFLQWMGER